MSIKDILDKKSLSIYQINDQIIRNIDFEDLTAREIDFLKENGFVVKFFPNNCFNKPYFRIIWRENYVKTA